MKPIAIALTVSITIASQAVSAEKTYDDYWKEASQAPGTVTKDYPRATVITNQKSLTVYIFTKPGDPAHPGVIIRKLVTDNGRTYFDTFGHSDGSDAAQPAFKTWMDNPFK